MTPTAVADLSARPSIAGLASRPWDLLVVGGGIIGAGIFHEAVRAGLRVLLVEQGDFASGTSSRSSKLIHGGLHYLARLQFRHAFELSRERDRLLEERAPLVHPLRMSLVPEHLGDDRPRAFIRAGLMVYRFMAAGRGAGWSLGSEPGPYSFRDAVSDDARLVLTEIREGALRGGTALNYCRMVELARGPAGVAGARIQDVETGACAFVRARVVVSARGPWTPPSRGAGGELRRVRLVRGSHLILPASRLPLRTGLVALRPGSGHYIVFVPWEGVTLVGTTSVECAALPDGEPSCSAEEVLTLLDDINRIFPRAEIQPHHIQATFAGLRPLVDLSTEDPGRASREEAIWEDEGVISVAGGKLTTFRATARRVLRRCGRRLPDLRIVPSRVDEAGAPAEGPDRHRAETGPGMNGRRRRATVFDPALPRLRARYGEEASRRILDEASMARIGGVRGHAASGSLEDPLAAAELRWIAGHEGGRRLEDLLLRRLRVGLTQPDGGLHAMRGLRTVLDGTLGWDDTRWAQEVEAYRARLASTYGVPDPVAAAGHSVVTIPPSTRTWATRAWATRAWATTGDGTLPVG